MKQYVAWKGTLFLPRCGSEGQEEGGERNYALCDYAAVYRLKRRILRRGVSC